MITNTINDINILRQFIEQKGSCEDIHCSDCIRIFSSSNDSLCRKHASIEEPDPKKEALAIKRLFEILKNISNK